MKSLSVVLLLVFSWIPDSTSVLRISPIACRVSVKDIAQPQPIILDPNSVIVHPFSATGQIELVRRQSVELYCPPTSAHPTGQFTTAKCINGKTFLIDGAPTDITTRRCSRWPTPVARRTNRACNGGTIAETGFNVSSRFVKQLEICFNEDLEVTRYVKHSLQPGNNYYTSNVDRPEFRPDIFFHKRDVDSLYKSKAYKNLFVSRMGSGVLRYNLTLARGHMAAMVDFVYGFQQRGTFLFLNAAPQWQSINNGNWWKMENSTRSWVSSRGKRVDCYTGVYGITTLPVNGVQHPLYLDYDANDNGLIPVPMLFFRVIIETSTKKGVVLITVNNPHQFLSSYVVCNDVSHQLTWLTWRKNVVQEGFSYACEVDAFARVNPHLPRFNVRGLLV